MTQIKTLPRVDGDLEAISKGELPSTMVVSLPQGKPPPFGHSLLDQFSFKPNYLNLNHGSYGSLPNFVARHCERISNEIESSPDMFMRRTLLVAEPQVRQKLATLIGAHTDEVVMVPNATHAVNTVLKNFEWRAEDIMIGFETTYGAVSRTLQYISDLPPHPNLHIIRLRFPTTHKEILSAFSAHLNSISRVPGQKIVAVIDAIVSNPGCILPWEDMVKVCKANGVWSVIDGAHAIGQIKLNMAESDPDFFITNCHKWLYAKRGCAILYVPKRNQHLIKSTFPTSFAYVSPSDPQIPGAPSAPNFVKQFEWTGTIDYTPYLSVDAALKFREWLGGEEAIGAYCHDLATSGGGLLANLLGTEIMDESGEMTANMVNVGIPFSDTSHLLPAQQFQVKTLIDNLLMFTHHTYVAAFVHNNKWWTRVSAQIWNQESDFEQLAKILQSVAKDVKEFVDSIDQERCKL